MTDDSTKTLVLIMGAAIGAALVETGLLSVDAILAMLFASTAAFILLAAYRVVRAELQAVM